MDVWDRVVFLVWTLCFSRALAENDDSDELRLMGGASRCEGTMELKHRGEWRRVMAQYTWWTLEAASVVCQSLDCGSAVSIEEKQQLNYRVMWDLRPDCVKEKSSVRDCADTGDYGNSDLQVKCSDSVRLVSGRSLCSGSLQILDQSLSRSWTWVCEGAMDRVGAEVLCRELGCGPPLLQGALSPLGQTFHCDGHESALMDCSRNQTRTNPETCSRLNLTCSEPLRLVGGASRCEGTLEAQPSGEWRRVTSDLWDLEAASVVCQSLDCGSAVFTEKKRRLKNRDVWSVRSDCVKKRSSVRDCAYSGYYGNNGLWMNCSGPLPHSITTVTQTSPSTKVNQASTSTNVTQASPSTTVTQASPSTTVTQASPSTNVTLASPSTTVTQASPSTTVTQASPLTTVTQTSPLTTEALVRPVVSVSEGLWTPRTQGGVWVHIGADFRVKCSIKLQFPGGSFRLLSPTVNITLPAVNHSAQFLFTDAGSAHEGNYTCVYLLWMLNHSFSSNSSLHICAGDAELILQEESSKTQNLSTILISISVVVIVMAIIITTVYGHRRSQTASSSFERETRRHKQSTQMETEKADLLPMALFNTWDTHEPRSPTVPQ